jgi:hypothetical protein
MAVTGLHIMYKSLLFQAAMRTSATATALVVYTRRESMRLMLAVTWRVGPEGRWAWGAGEP